MGDVIQLRPRPGSPNGANPVADIPDTDPGSTVSGTGTDTTIPVDTGTGVAAAPVSKPVAAPRLQRPEWLGVRQQNRQALRAGLWRTVRRTAARILFELVQGIPRRGWHVLHWFGRGIIGYRNTDGVWTGGWVALLGWCFAARERADAKAAAAETPGGAIRATEHADTLAWWHTGIVVIPHIVGALVLNRYLPGYWWLVFAPLVVGTTIYGHHVDPKPPAPVAAPRAREHVGIESMNAALRAIDILAKPTTAVPEPDGVRLATLPRTVGGGQESRWNLPASCGKAAVDVINKRDRLAGAFATPYEQFILDPGSHPGEFVVWQSSKDPFAGPVPEHPLMARSRWDVWEPVPFGRDARGKTVTMSLVFTSLLVGARPRRGKSFAARSAIAGAVLDPSTRFHVADGKGGGTWAALKPLSHDFVEGADDEDVDKVAHMLRLLVTDMRARHRRIPGSKTTRALSRDPAADCPVTFVIVDEVQEYLESHRKGEITESLTKLAKVGPSAGYCLLLITQRPDADSFPTGLRAVLGARFALEVMSYEDSNIILGPAMSKLGHNASLITHRDVGLLRPDDDANGEPDDERSIRAVRTFDMADDQWGVICATGADLRRVSPDHRSTDGEDALNRASAGPVYATPTELFMMLRQHAARVLDRVAATDVHAMGMRLPIKKEAHKVNRRGVYDVRRAELALDLPQGSLGAPSDLPPLEVSDVSEAPPSEVGGTPETGGEAPPELPLFRPTGTTDEEA